ncbi:vacuolar protein sorting protein VPS53 [Acrasis kona]|uniref:Vacuolar protein sorting protein VPS53 n=1 Tax=Acrasis kona TaxID=1008807 RepID=A0AAW2YUU9_9EUKA
MSETTESGTPTTPKIPQSLSLEDVQPIRLSKQVDNALAAVLPSGDVFDSPYFDPVEYINQIFPNEQSLNENLETFALKVKKKIHTVDEEILSSIRRQSTAGYQAKKDLDEAKTTIRSLFTKVSDIKQKAEQSEMMVQKITKDIKSLDYGKRNLTQTITALANLRVLVSAVDQLGTLTNKRQYAEVANKLGAVNQLLTTFDQYKDIAKIKHLRVMIDEIRKNLAAQITDDFKSMERLQSEGRPEALLHDACLVVDQLSESVRVALIKQFVKQQIDLYRMMFRKGKQESKLDEIKKRFNWCKKKQNDYQERYSQVFPEHWCVPQELTLEFCLATREDISEVLKTNRDTLSAKVLHKAIIHTIKFEAEMHKKYHVGFQDQDAIHYEKSPNSPDIDDEEDKIKWKLEQKLRRMQKERDTQKSASQLSEASNAPTAPKKGFQYNFSGLISTCFEDYMNTYLTFEDQTMSQTITKILERETWGVNMEYNSSEDLFIYVTESMNACTSFSKGKILYRLSDQVWKKYLRKYAEALTNKLTALKVQTTNTSKEAFKFDIASLRDIIHQSSRDDRDKDNQHHMLSLPRLTDAEESAACYVISIADYCQQNIESVEDELKSILEEPFSNQVDLSQEQAKFYTVLKLGVDVLIMNVMNTIEIELNNKMLKINWSTFEDTGDQSEYVSSICGFLNESVPSICNHLPLSRFKFFCDNLVVVFWHVYISYIYKCKRLSDMGAKQIQMDVISTSSFFKNLINLGDPTRFDEDEVASFHKKVESKSNKAYHILKLASTPSDLLLQHYKNLVPDGDVQDLYKIMDLKGMDHQDKKELAQRYVKEGGDGVIVPTPELSQPQQQQQQQQQQPQKNDLMALMRRNVKDLF